MFTAIKGFKKEDLLFVVEEIGEELPEKVTTAELKRTILKSKEYFEDPEFVSAILLNAVTERKLEEQRKLEDEERKFQAEKENKQHEIELARIHAQSITVAPSETQFVAETSGIKKKFHLPKLEFRQFSGNVIDWLPFWSQFTHIHLDEDIAPENKYQYLVQATVVGSRAREVVDSFPPTGANYAKAIESLKARFGREDLLVEVYVRELLKLIISVQKNEKFLMTSLYDKLESYLRALESLDVTTDKCASILYPMVESCFSEEFLRAWNRCPSSSSSTDAKERLNNLMLFFKAEVEGEERINLAMSGFGLSEKVSSQTFRRKSGKQDRNKLPTAANLLITPVKDSKKLCVFCNGAHYSADCFSAQKMSLADRQNVLKEKNCCFACLHPGHPIRKCRIFLRCVDCGKKHVPLMCDRIESRKHEPKQSIDKEIVNEVNMSNISPGPKVFLQTLKVALISDKKETKVRIILDSGSQKSYILKSIAEEMDYTPLRKETLTHSLFGGVKSERFEHTCYKIRLRNIVNNFTCNFEALDQTTICNDITPVSSGSWMSELQKMNITLTDVGEKPEPVQVLIGADLFGKFLTGQRRVLSCGLVAMETLLGWTLLGKVPEKDTTTSNAMLVTSLFVKEFDISELWKLDSIGIKDPIEKISKKEQEDLTKERFLQTVKYIDERYEVHLPWKDDCVPLPDNLELAKRRLDSTTKKLLSENLYENYEGIFMEWIKTGIIEEVPAHEIKLPGNYLPHRPVIKESSSTPIRPVFDASARMKGHPSLNESLHTGPNLIELIPDILLRFREKRFAATADIRKAFLQISVCQKDRDFLRFLWWKNKDCRDYKVFRHTRVVFGVRSSPFLLEAVLKYHIDNMQGVDSCITKCLSNNFYVDNLITSVHSELELNQLISVSNDLLKKGGFELRDWECSLPKEESFRKIGLLGLLWDKSDDILSLNLKWLSEVNIENITKRTILSAAHKVFDPFGFAAPVMLCPKIMLQKAWKLSLGWDDVLPGDLQEEFVQWFRELEALKEIRVPRWINITPESLKNCSVHTFCDASKHAYAAVTYLVQESDYKNVHFLASRSRIAPSKSATIPRLELIAATVGARLCTSLLKGLGWENVPLFFWSDSTTALSWIQRDEKWSTFVHNRVQEIRQLTDLKSWRHIPGCLNPADLPSRGCSGKQLLLSRWWEGPSWLKEHEDKWPLVNVTPDEDAILTEKRKCNKEESSKCLTNTVNSSVDGFAETKNVTALEWYCKRFSSYNKILRIVAWIKRFSYNSRKTNHVKLAGELTCWEIDAAEKNVIRLVQKESFTSKEDKRLATLDVYEDEQGLLRIKTKIVFKKDTEDFRCPAILPSEHVVVKRLILEEHLKNCHAGTQMLLNILREYYWILNARKAIRSLISKCVICLRHRQTNLSAPAAALPENRTKDASVFEIIGIDLTGPCI